MKKFCNKLTKQQWRVSVPNININSNLFRRSQSKGDDENEIIDEKKSKKNKRVSSGCYDLEEAERAFDRSLSVPDAVFAEPEVCTDTTSTISSDGEYYEDASNNTGINCSRTTIVADEYTTVIPIESSTTNLTENNGKYTYDVPKISFSFFDESSKGNEETSNKDLNYDVVTSSKPVHKSELKIVLSTPMTNINEDDILPSPTNSEYADAEALPPQDDFPNHNVIMKCGSDPTLRIQEQEDDGLYKVPNMLLRRNRLSMSLNDFNPDKIETINSAHSSIEHISCSQVIPQGSDKLNQSNYIADDYCKARSKLPMKLRRVTFLRKPKTKAVDTWVSIKTKMNEMMSNESSAGQLSEREKIALNIEEMYKHSKDKCKKVFKSTGKMFRKKNNSIETKKGDTQIETTSNIDQEEPQNNDESSTYSQIIKNPAFFDNIDKNIQPSPELYTESTDSFSTTESSSKKSSSLKLQSVTDIIDEYSSIKSAFRRSKFYHNNEVS